jgi:cellulose synthase/poly-beta-1,6-N-acetylglucosamine synthase-like glycosyltransferase
MADSHPVFRRNFPSVAVDPAGPDQFLSHLYWLVSKQVLLTGDTSPANINWLRVRHGAGVRIIGCPPRVVLAAIERKFRDVFRQRAVADLSESEPQFSASTVITRGQRAALVAVFAFVSLTLFAAPQLAVMALAAIFGVLFVANAGFRAVLLWVGAGEQPPVPMSLADDPALPVYSILVPLYREANVMPALVRALRALDYPKRCLDIKLIVEADDRDTAIVADAVAAYDPCFSVIRVPPGTPRTKPRACNYAMPFVFGEFTVIFDAEDRPEPDQLRKAVAVFRAAPDNIACLQARLNFYNANENWLTRMFALDYALWFDYLLPGLDRLNIPMPLGGTSNHFRTAALRAIHCWDPYNVTEDADIGIRLARVGLRVRTLDSTTFEEATNSFGNWLRQRSRWLKGYMQTWLVHMRSPLALLRNAGLGGFIGFQLFVGGTFLSALANPLLWAIFLLSKIFGVHIFNSPAAAVAAHVSIVSLAAGNGMFAYLAMLGPLRRGWLELTPYGLTAPLYWLLISCAGARALWQLFVRPWYWEKTAHGLSKMGIAP